MREAAAPSLGESLLWHWQVWDKKLKETSQLRSPPLHLTEELAHLGKERAVPLGSSAKLPTERALFWPADTAMVKG